MWAGVWGLGVLALWGSRSRCTAALAGTCNRARSNELDHALLGIFACFACFACFAYLQLPGGAVQATSCLLACPHARSSPLAM